MKRPFIQAVFILLLAILFYNCHEQTPPGAFSEPVMLQFNFSADSNYKYILDSKLTLKPEVKGQTLNITQNIKLVASFHVLNTNRFGRNVTVNYDRIVMTSDNGVNKSGFDSDDSTNHDPLFAQVRSLVNAPYHLLVKSNGAVMTSNDNDSTRVTDSSMRKMLLQCLNVYPDKAVKPGDTWQKSYNTSTGFLHMRIENRYLLNSISKGIAHIDVSGKISPEDSLQDLSFKGVQSGSMEIDVKTGAIISSKITQQLSGTIKLGGKSNPVNAEGEITISKFQ